MYYWNHHSRRLLEVSIQEVTGHANLKFYRKRQSKNLPDFIIWNEKNKCTIFIQEQFCLCKTLWGCRKKNVGMHEETAYKQHNCQANRTDPGFSINGSADVKEEVANIKSMGRINRPRLSLFLENKMLRVEIVASRAKKKTGQKNIWCEVLCGYGFCRRVDAMDTNESGFLYFV